MVCDARLAVFSCSCIYHYDDVIMTMLASQITSLMVVYSIVYSGVNQRKHQSSASLAFVREIHRGPVNFPHKWPVTRKMFPFDDVIMLVTVLKCDNKKTRCGSPMKCYVYLLITWIEVCSQLMYATIKFHRSHFTAQTVSDTNQLGIRRGLQKINTYVTCVTNGANLSLKYILLAVTDRPNPLKGASQLTIAGKIWIIFCGFKIWISSDLRWCGLIFVTVSSSR